MKNNLFIQEYVYEREIHIVGYMNNSGALTNVGISECTVVNIELPTNGEKTDCFYFNRIFVRPEYRNNGYATLLLKKMIEKVKERNIPICCDINSYGDLSNDQLFEWYKSFGFKEYEVRYSDIKYNQLWLIW